MSNSVAEDRCRAVAFEDMGAQLRRLPEMLDAGLRLPDERDDRLVDRRLAAQRPGEIDHLAVEIVDLGRPAGGKVVEHGRARLGVDLLNPQEQIVEVDVRNSAQAVETARQRVLSAREARINAETQLEGEQRLYQVGRSTTFLLFQRENALANARASELRAETDYNKALADLQRATSTTLRANNVVVGAPVSTTP